MSDVPLPKFRLSLLGRFELTGPNGPIDVPIKKLAGLLAYLACTAPVPQAREKLTTLLWGSHFDAQARQNLRQALFRLRRTLGRDALIGDCEEISFAPRAVECDAARFDKLVREGSRASLAEAVELYRESFLADVAIKEDAWADWVAGERRRLEELALDALVRFGEIELAAGYADKALETVQRALAINNLREDAHRLIIQALAAAGRKAEALKHYQDLGALLKRELETEPDPVTKLLVANLGRMQPGPPVRSAVASCPASPERLQVKGLPQSLEAWQVRAGATGSSRFEARRAGARTLSPLVGRHEEMELLLRRWDQAKLGEGRIVLLSGEPGIGKSRIAETLLTRLEGEPHSRLRYFCFPHNTHGPLHPFIRQLEQAAGFAPGDSAAAKLDKLEALLRPAARNVPRDLALIAELLAVPTDGRYPVVEVNPRQKREMTFTALLDQIGGVAARSPVLVVFEDAHCIDPTSLELLDRMVDRVAELPVLLVVTFRPECQPTWVGQPQVTLLPLSRLGRRDSTGIIGGIAKGKALPAAVLEQILVHTHGVPLFIEELTKSTLESSELKETADRYEYVGTTRGITIPATRRDSLMALKTA
jgi:DNA-binding SARP family transcriptional activator